jgi:hypothetical protein
MSGSYLDGGGNQVPSKAERLEHAQISGVHGKKVFPITLPPTAQTNPSLVITYNASDQISTIAKTIGVTTYTKTYTYTDNLLTGVSAWV